MSFFKKNQPEATIQKPSEEEAKYNAACINMEIATGNFKHMTQADICACVAKSFFVATIIFAEGYSCKNSAANCSIM